MWTKQSLQQLIKEKLSDYKFIVASNRQPYIHTFKKGEVECQRGAGGVITALDPILQACNGTWVAHGSGDADRRVTDNEGKVMVPPEKPNYTLKRVWLTKEEEKGHYYGYSNEALWPLCHMAFERPVFSIEDWEYYKTVNNKFAEAILKEVGNDKAFVWVQDYHLTLLPKLLKEKAPGQLIIAHFWHIPWPNHETFRICPQKHEILEGLLASNLLAFHIRYHCDNFIDVVEREIECKIDKERFSIIRQEHETIIRPYPISVDFEGCSIASRQPQVKRTIQALRKEYNLSGVKVLLGLDRIDYTKGIPERLFAVDRLLDLHPELKEKIVFIQMGELSRIHIPKYKALNDEINARVEEINWKHSTGIWEPIILVRRHLSFPELLAFYRLGDVCIVSSLHDGMNLVAKEFISSRSDGEGVLVLSQFTGASRELEEAILVNPYDRTQFAEAIFEALSFNEEDRKRRMVKLRATVERNNIYRWAGKNLSELFKIEFKEE